MARVELETVIPPPRLRPFVRRYLYSSRPLKTEAVFHGKPTGYACLSSFFGQARTRRGSINGRPFNRFSRCFLFGQITDQEVRLHQPASGLLVAELAATGHHRLFGRDGRRILGLAAALDDAAPAQASIASQCFRLGDSASRAEHVAEANAFFTRVAQSALPADPSVEQAVRLLEASNGTIRIGEICRRLGIDRRRLNRGFTRIVGLTPKFFGRILQINRVVDLLHSNDQAELAQIAQEAGFYDQAHFNHAMRRFFNQPPREFVRSRHHDFQPSHAGFRRMAPPPSPPPQ